MTAGKKKVAGKAPAKKTALRRSRSAAASSTGPGRKTKQVPAAQHLSHAHQRLLDLRARIGRHPELEETIEQLEKVLNALTLKTGGML
jgi:hypothetical protein